MAQLCPSALWGSHGAAFCDATELGKCVWAVASAFRRKAANTSICLDRRRIDDVLGDEPDLELIGANHRAYEEVVRPVVTGFVGQAGHRAGLLQDDFVGVENTRDLDGDRLTALWRPRNQ